MPEKTDANDAALSFDLTEQPWIEVLRRDGTQDELSLREVFAQADGVRRIAGDLPTQEFALLRLLLVIAHDAVEGPQGTLSTGRSCGAIRSASGVWMSTSTLIGTALTYSAPRLRSFRRQDCARRKMRCSPSIGSWPMRPTVSRTSRRGCRPSTGSASRRPLGGSCTRTRTTPPASRAVSMVTPAPRAARSTRSGWAGPATSAAFSSKGTPCARRCFSISWLPTRAACGSNPPTAPPGGASRAAPAARNAHRRASGTCTPGRAGAPAAPRRLGRADGVVLGNGDPLNARNKHVVEPMTAWRRSEAQEKKTARPWSTCRASTTRSEPPGVGSLP
ncbi:hypothetical protein SBADM41S_03767 [Streptomyces badius]